ncbi:MAG: SBBP repeat-containing protein, partial [Aureispira sp.]
MNAIQTILLLLFIGSTLVAQQSSPLVQANTFIGQQKAAFEENKGQVWGPSKQTATTVQYHYKKRETDIFMLSTGIAYQFTKIHYPEGYKSFSKRLSKKEEAAQEQLRKQIRIETYRMDMELVNANPNPTIIADGKSKDYVQYYNRNALNVHSFQKLIYQEVYPGIDWVIYTTDKGLKYDFLVQPGADPKQIQLKFKHHEDLKINADGSFTLSNRMGEITEQAPVSFQNNQVIKTAFKLENDVISFEFAGYNKNQLLTIDPSFIWGTYYGGTNDDQGASCTVDSSGNIYFAGRTESNSNIAIGGHQNTRIGANSFIVKFNSAGVRQWASYYSGTTYSSTTDRNGNVYLVGQTASNNNISFNGHQNTYGGGTRDAFIVKFNSAGVRQWGTYYGGTRDDRGFACAIDINGNVYFAGETNSSNNISFNGHQNTTGSFRTTFLVKFNHAGVRQWATYGSGNRSQYSRSCAIDGNGNIYLVGSTQSNTNFSTSGVHQGTYGGNGDAFIVKFNPSGTRLWASYYGGSDAEDGESCAIDGNGNIYLGGTTSSTNNIAAGGHQNTYGGGTRDAFIVKFNSVGVRQWASYYGGSDAEDGGFCAIDGNGYIYLGGTTSSTNNIAAGGHQNTYGGGTHDAFIVKFNSVGVRQWASYYGGSDAEDGGFCAIDGNGYIYLGGTTSSTNNIAAGGHQNTYGGGTRDAFIVKLNSVICSNTTGTDTISTCNTYTWIDGNTYNSSNNTATFTLTNAAGCDLSLIHI